MSKKAKKIYLEDMVKKFPPLTTPEDEELIKKFYEQHPILISDVVIGDWIQTYTGKKFFSLNPKEEDIDIKDIAHALSMICRYNGHSSKFYSVAEHSVLVSYLGDPKYGLLHDCSEAYICDVASPIKKLPEFETYRKIEYNLQQTIYKKYGLNDPIPESTKKADLLMLSTEAHYLMNVREDWVFKYEPLPFFVKCLEPEKAEKLFLNRFKELFGV